MNRVKTSRAAYGALLASLVALAGGCGGGEERLAREEITERANEICRELDRKVAAAPTPRDLESMEAFAG